MKRAGCCKALRQVSATVTWTIENVEIAARMAAQTMYTNSAPNSVGDPLHMPKLRNDVLRQALASLSAFIGSLRFPPAAATPCRSAAAVWSIGSWFQSAADSVTFLQSTSLQNPWVAGGRQVLGLLRVVVGRTQHCVYC